MPIIQMPLSSLEVQLTGRKTTTPVTVRFTDAALSVRFDGLDRYFEVDFALMSDGDLKMIIRDYHDTPEDSPEIRLIHSWAAET